MLHEVKFRSFNQRDDVYGWIYVPACQPKGIVQLVHGFGEHSRRYFHMIVRFMEAGFIVAADDHVGHGKTALENDTWGNWGSAGPDTMMEDEYTLKKVVQKKYPNIPYFMYGHSMGSIITRQFIAKYGNELAGAIICGTVGPDAVPCAQGIELLRPLVEAGKGAESDPAMLGNLLGGLFSRIEEVKIGNEWICHDPYVQLDHAQDPFDAFTKPTCNEALLQFIQMVQEVNTPEWASKVPQNLPLYNVAGDEDPCGSFGDGVELVSNWLVETGHNVDTVLYEGYRHEIHNYADLKDEMVDGMIEFLNKALA
ncbi:MAG: alpha/beta hydrolase [Erysipelotrichaceae bacterium]|nr:alpha/beta hydrolase [Erysipelotrichaceae bacterium]